MSTIGIFSYLIVFSIFLLNAFKNLKGVITANIFFASLMGYLLTFNYFSNIQEHHLFPVLISLFYISYYTVLIFKTKRLESANLFVNAGQVLLPVYLVTASTLWEQLVVIALLETVRLVNSSGSSVRRTTNSVLNFININFKIFLIVLTFSLLFLVTGTSSFEAIIRIDSALIILPICLLYILSFVFTGGMNSKKIELININNYKSQNFLAYSYIYQFLIPFVFLAQIKRLLSFVSFDIYSEVSLILSILTIFFVVYMMRHLVRCMELDFKIQIIKALTFTALNLIFIFSPKMTIYTYVLYGTTVVLLNSLLLLGNQYKIKYKNKTMFMALLVSLMTPVSPLFYYFINSLENIETVNKDLVSIIIFAIMVILNFTFHGLSTQILKKFETKQYNIFATQRVVYLGLGILLTSLAIVYDKI